MPYYNNHYNNPTVVIMDLETTGLDPYCHITQLAAKCGRREFNVYVLPNRHIDPQASAITGFEFDGESLYVRGRRVAALHLYDAILQFVGFLRSCHRSKGGEVILAAHNGLSFDARHLLKAAGWVGLREDLEEVVDGFADTIPLFRQEEPFLQSYALKALARRFLGYNGRLHSALADVRVLDQLIDELGITDDEIVQSAVEASDVY